MKKSLFLLIFIMLFRVAGSQVISGSVLNKDSGEKIPFAAIYFSGSFVGTYSDTLGNFRIDVSSNIGMPISVSAVGYYSASIEKYSPDELVSVWLKPKIIDLDEVVINARSKARERKNNLGIFKKVFLGTTPNAIKCQILNANDISFSSSADRDTLRAFASNPIEIENKALGYKIIYFLDKFEYCIPGGSFSYKGNIIFNEDILFRKGQKRFIENSRTHAFNGSRMKFFRMLWADSLILSEFSVLDSSRNELVYNEIVVTGPDEKKYMSYKENLILFDDMRQEASPMIFLKDSVYFDRKGYFDASGISWEGPMVYQRVGDELPYEFVLPEAGRKGRQKR